MVLYSLLAIPLFCLFLVASKFSGGSDAKRLWVQFSRGVLVFIPVYLILLLIRTAVPLRFSYASIYAYYFIYHALYYSALGSLGYIIIKRFSADAERGSVSEAFVFLAGFFTFSSVLDIVRNFPYFDSYELFLYPTMKLAVIAALAFLLARYVGGRGWGRWGYLAVGALFVAMTAFVPFLFMIHLSYAAVIITAALLAISLFPYLIMSL